LKDELEKELDRSRTNIQALEQELSETKARIEDREKRIKELSQQEQKLEESQSSVYEKTLNFLRTKSTFLNARYKTIEELKRCFITLENKFGKHDAIGEIGNSISNIGGTLETLTFSIPKIAGEAIKLSNTFSKLNLISKSSREFQVSLIEEKELSQLNDAYNSLVKLIKENKETNNILNLETRRLRSGKAKLFNTDYETSSILNEEGI